MFRIAIVLLNLLLLLSCRSNGMSKEKATATAWFALGSALPRKTLMDVEWSFYKKLNTERGKCYVFRVNENSQLNYSETEHKIWQAGFTVNAVDKNGGNPDVVLTNCKDKILLCIAVNKINSFLEKFPIASKEIMQSEQQNTTECTISANNNKIATKKFLVIKALSEGDSEQVKILLQQFSRKMLSSPNLTRKCIAASMVPKNSNKLSESLAALQKFGISVKSLPDNEIEQLLFLTLHDDKNTQNGLLQPLLSNYNANEPDKGKVFEITNKLCNLLHGIQK